MSKLQKNFKFQEIYYILPKYDKPELNTEISETPHPFCRDSGPREHPNFLYCWTLSDFLSVEIESVIPITQI